MSTQTPKFFVPYAKDEAQAEQVWDATKEFMEKQGNIVTDRRIYSIAYTYHGEECFDKVGDKDRYGMEEILVLLETDRVYLCCTQNRGVVRGEPILTGKSNAHITDFPP